MNTPRNKVLDEVINRLRDRAVMTDNWEWADSLQEAAKIVESMKDTGAQPGGEG